MTFKTGEQLSFDSFDIPTFHILLHVSEIDYIFYIQNNISLALFQLIVFQHDSSSII